MCSPRVFQHSYLGAPLLMTRQVIENTLRSTVFLAAFPTMYLAVICLKNQLKLPESRFWYWAAGLVGASSIFMEKKSRRQELALYVLPRAAESAALIYVSKRWLPHVRLEICVCVYVGGWGMGGGGV